MVNKQSAVTKDHIAMTIRSLIAEHLEVEIPRVSDETDLFSDLGADWLDRLELMIAIEERFNVEFADDDVEKLLAVGDLIRFIEANVQV